MAKVFHFFIAIFVFFSIAYATEHPLTINAPSTQYEEAQAYLWHNIVTDDNSEYLAFHVTLQDGWKTYWRSSDINSLPPIIKIDAASDIALGDIEYPPPQKTTLFGVDSFVYENEVVFLVPIMRDTTKNIQADIGLELLVCDDICIPATFNFNVTLAPITTAHVNLPQKFLKAKAKIPLNIDDFSPFGHAKITSNTLDISLKKDMAIAYPLRIIMEYQNTLAVQHIMNNAQMAIPLNSQAALNRVNIFSPNLHLSMDAKHITQSAYNYNYLYIIFFAFIGGLLLNFMPCVLPALGLKAMSLQKLRVAQNTHKQYRRAIFAFIAGIICFFMLASVIIIILRMLGYYVGWGVHFQEPLFLWFMLGLMLYFTRWFLWPSFQKQLPFSLYQSLHKVKIFNHDFGLGLTIALLSTSCSVPFLGTAIAFALNGSMYDILAIFVFLALGLAAPWFLLLMVPRYIDYFPKGGFWLHIIQKISAILMLGTGVYFLYLLYVAVSSTAFIVLLLWLIFFLLDGIQYFSKRSILRLSSKILLLGVSIYAVLMYEPSNQTAYHNQDARWQQYSPALLNQYTQENQNIFIDVTADWCLSCKFNKVNILDRDFFYAWAAQNNVILLRADWTRPNKDIATLLEKYNKYGIPFNLYVNYDNKTKQYNTIIYNEILLPSDFE